MHTVRNLNSKAPNKINNKRFERLLKPKKDLILFELVVCSILEVYI